MAQIKILDKEKDYLLSVNPYQFVDSLDSASIFYELLKYDQMRNKNESNNYALIYNNISLIGIYNCLLNLISHNIYEGLVLRHHLIYKKPDRQFNLNNFSLKINCVDYKDKNLYQEFKYQLGYDYLNLNDYCVRILDEIIMSSNLSVFEHKIYIFPDEMTNDFLSKMLILYEDFVDNIPI
jgi:hypothetical protein